MCGIVGYVGKKNATTVLLNGLATLEYRGYDSAGVAFFKNSEIRIVKAKGRLDNLKARLEEMNDVTSNCGIGHTRWATHGEPSDINSHPHCGKKVALVHNGIIENYMDLKKELLAQGYMFESQTAITAIRWRQFVRQSKKFGGHTLSESCFPINPKQFMPFVRTVR